MVGGYVSYSSLSINEKIEWKKGLVLRHGGEYILLHMYENLVGYNKSK